MLASSIHNILMGIQDLRFRFETSYYDLPQNSNRSLLYSETNLLIVVGINAALLVWRQLLNSGLTPKLLYYLATEVYQSSFSFVESINLYCHHSYTCIIFCEDMEKLTFTVLYKSIDNLSGSRSIIPTS
jgi:hypothetical protein